MLTSSPNVKFMKCIIIIIIINLYLYTKSYHKYIQSGSSADVVSMHVSFITAV